MIKSEKGPSLTTVTHSSSPGALWLWAAGYHLGPESQGSPFIALDCHQKHSLLQGELQSFEGHRGDLLVVALVFQNWDCHSIPACSVRQ